MSDDTSLGTPPVDEPAADDAAADELHFDSDDDAALLQAYRHDIHKLRGRSHENAAETVADTPVNDTVPQGADRDAALLSRPRGEPDITVGNHHTPHRLSLLTGSCPAAETDLTDSQRRSAVHALVRTEPAAVAHRAWLGSTVPALFNESPYYPYTSQKYHTLLTAALLANYREPAAYAECFLVVDPPATDLQADSIVPHKTILATDAGCLRLTDQPGDRPATRLGADPSLSFGDVWSRLPAHPFDIEGDRQARILDAQLRRIRSWSTALQYIEDRLPNDRLCTWEASR